MSKKPVLPLIEIPLPSDCEYDYGFDRSFSNVIQIPEFGKSVNIIVSSKEGVVSPMTYSKPTIVISFYQIDVSLYPDLAQYIYRFDLEDDPNQGMRLVSYLPVISHICDLAYDKGFDILFHCRGGISRSVSALIGWLMSRGLSFDRANSLISSHRNEADPNVGFITALNDVWSKICNQPVDVTTETLLKHTLRSPDTK